MVPVDGIGDMNPVEAWRIERGLSKYRVEMRTGLSHQTVYNVFATGAGSIETLQRIADCLGVELWELLRGPAEKDLKPSRDAAPPVVAPGVCDEPDALGLGFLDIDNDPDPLHADSSAIAYRMRRAVHARTTQRALAERLGTLEANVSRWLTGRHEPSLSMFQKICTVLDVSSDVILGLQPEGSRGQAPIVAHEAFRAGADDAIDPMALPSDSRSSARSDAQLMGIQDRALRDCLALLEEARGPLTGSCSALLEAAERLEQRLGKGQDAPGRVGRDVRAASREEAGGSQL